MPLSLALHWEEWFKEYGSNFVFGVDGDVEPAVDLQVVGCAFGIELKLRGNGEVGCLFINVQRGVRHAAADILLIAAAYAVNSLKVGVELDMAAFGIGGDIQKYMNIPLDADAIVRTGIKEEKGHRDRIIKNLARRAYAGKTQDHCQTKNQGQFFVLHNSLLSLLFS
jgi:hypothetical protein